MYKIWYHDEAKPKYCTKCRKELTTKQLSAGWNAYTGEEAFKNFLACPDAVKTLLDTHHDVWEIEDVEAPIIKMAYY